MKEFILDVSFELERSLASSCSVGSHILHWVPGQVKTPCPRAWLQGQQQGDRFKPWPHAGELVVLALGSWWHLVRGPCPGRGLSVGIRPWDGWWAWEVESGGLWEVLSALFVQTTLQTGQKPTGRPSPPCLANIHIHRSTSIKWCGYNDRKQRHIKIKVGNQKAWLQSLPTRQHGRTTCEFQMLLGHRQLQVWARGRHRHLLPDPFPPVRVIFVFLLTLIMHHYYVEEREWGRWPSPVPLRPNSEPLNPPCLCFLSPLLQSGPW